MEIVNFAFSSHKIETSDHTFRWRMGVKRERRRMIKQEPFI